MQQYYEKLIIKITFSRYVFYCSRPLAKLDNAEFDEQLAARLGTDDAAKPCGSQVGSDEALQQIDRKGGAVQFRKRSSIERR